MKKKLVFLTGATGNMGWAGFKELYARKDHFDIRILARPSKKNFKLLKEYMYDKSVQIVWGDLCDYDDVLCGVKGADFVLHVGGMVSPAADYYPEKTLSVNVKAAENIVKAVLAQPDQDKIKLVYIGSVAQMGHRSFPKHWGRIGDPVKASAFDMYSVSKCQAEKLIVDSGVKHWVSLRQSGILYPGILSVVGPTAFHVPVSGVLEWCTIEDAGKLLANVCEDWVKEEFWNNFYNIGSGQAYRLTNYEFETKLLKALGLPGPEKVFNPEWFALKNFHGMWYADSERLEDYLHFRHNVPIEEYFASMKSKLPWFYSLAFLAPAFAVKMFMKPYAFENGLGTQSWLKDAPDKFRAYYGDVGSYKAIKSWDDVIPADFEKNKEKAIEKKELIILDHGYDESKSIYDLTYDEICKAAEFRGGRLLSSAQEFGAQSFEVDGLSSQHSDELSSQLQSVEESQVMVKGKNEKGKLYEWECEHGHKFTASLEYVLLGGGWCMECNLDKLDDESTPKNKFMSQVRGL